MTSCTTEAQAGFQANEFADFGLNQGLLTAIERAGFTVPTEVQRLAIPAVTTGSDLIVKAQTGTGKTAAFGLPCLNKIKPKKSVQLLVLTPTRELAIQVAEELQRFGTPMGLKVATVYGGQGAYHQLLAIEKGCQVVVATPGRLLDYMRNGKLPGFAPRMMVVDEADEMLTMGFIDDVQDIFAHLPENRQTLMFSATMPGPVRTLAEKHLRDPQLIEIVSKERLPESIEQRFYVVQDGERCDALVRLIEAEEPAKAIVFCRTRRDTDDLQTQLVSRGIRAKALHGDLDQDQRQAVTKALRDGALSIVVATDVAARGLDIVGLTHVFNFEIPTDPAAYVHRIGRTGRAGQAGKALSLVSPRELGKLRFISSSVGAKVFADEIPSRSRLQERVRRRLSETVASQETTAEAEALHGRLTSRFSSDELATKLLSMVLDMKAQAAGKSPDNETIGFNLAAIERLMSNRGSKPGFGGQRRGQHAAMDRRGRPAGRHQGHHHKGRRPAEARGSLRSK